MGDVERFRQKAQTLTDIVAGVRSGEDPELHNPEEFEEMLRELGVTYHTHPTDSYLACIGAMQSFADTLTAYDNQATIPASKELGRDEKHIATAASLGGTLGGMGGALTGEPGGVLAGLMIGFLGGAAAYHSFGVERLFQDTYREGAQQEIRTERRQAQQQWLEDNNEVPRKLYEADRKFTSNIDRAIDALQEGILGGESEASRRDAEMHFEKLNAAKNTAGIPLSSYMFDTPAFIENFNTREELRSLYQDDPSTFIDLDT